MIKINKFDILISTYIFCILVSELMGSKTFTIFSLNNFQLNASVGIFLVPLIYSIYDIISEVQGKDRAASLLQSGFVVILMLIVFAFLAINLPPSPRFLASQQAYHQIFSKSIRISISSLLAFAISGAVDIYIFSKLKALLKHTQLWLRNNLSNFVSQFFDTIIFITFSFYALDKSPASNFTFLVSLILPYWLLKCLISVIETPLVYLGVKWLRK